LVAGVYVPVAAFNRLGADSTVASGPMLPAGALGLLVYVPSSVLLRGGSTGRLAVRGAYLPVSARPLGSFGLIVASVLMQLTGSPLWDLVVAVAIAVFVVVRAVMLGRQVFAVLAQHAPAGVDPVEVGAGLASIRGVRDVHDLHLWTLTSGMDVAT